MKVRYEMAKGNRIKKGTKKVTIDGVTERIDNFEGLDCEDVMLGWCEDTNSWVDLREDVRKGYWLYSCNEDIKNLKQAIRHIRKHNEIPKGTQFTLSSNFKGYDIYITK